ncbi:TrkA family potassium uptake protein [Dehalococcoidia bacterium]|nr:TrkA family potassium uptake protein [Dehalococcoidia bacterium]MCL0048669.1 TrkA family potassium uptake protein [Dehalococcoidia bacterium]MCL0055983.1 TrkA family potassium uptake protein [Dehalococcoidia bacterium]MCL0078952.1 TrkA family potassium uptake protein [Dehalococcoidia bacterium]MCL0090043.1 TrkA family potassium uptake protein [Dehalococcoidia bacterium]
MNVIIMGCGRVGARLAGILDSEGHKVTILDTDPYSFRRIPPNFAGEALIGSGTDEDALKKAGIEEADIFIAVTQGDNRNVMATQIAKHIFNVPRGICRIYDPIREEMYRELGLETISPTKVGAQLLRGVIGG